MDEIRALMGQMNADEQILLQQRAAEAAATTRNAELTVGFGTLLALLVVIVATVTVTRAVSRPLQETTGVLASSAAEILAATTQQASGAAESSAAVAETVATVDEVARTAEQASERAKALAATAQRAAELGDRGAQGGGCLRERHDDGEGARGVHGAEHAGAGRAGAGHRGDHLHRQRHRRTDQHVGPQCGGGSGQSRRAGPRLRGGGR